MEGLGTLGAGDMLWLRREEVAAVDMAVERRFALDQLITHKIMNIVKLAP